jgi:hypothetical protein
MWNWRNFRSVEVIRTMTRIQERCWKCSSELSFWVNVGYFCPVRDCEGDFQPQLKRAALEDGDGSS